MRAEVRVIREHVQRLLIQAQSHLINLTAITGDHAPMVDVDTLRKMAQKYTDAAPVDWRYEHDDERQG